MKRIIVIVILLLVLVVWFLIYNESETYRSWGIKLPGIQISKVIFNSGFQDGNQILVVKYYSTRKIKKMIEINNFETISFENVEDIRNSLIDFYNGLGTNEEGIDGKEVYDASINVEQLLKLNNYYLIKIKNQNKSYIILILDMENKKLYTFTTVR